MSQSPTAQGGSASPTTGAADDPRRRYHVIFRDQARWGSGHRDGMVVYQTTDSLPDARLIAASIAQEGLTAGGPALMASLSIGIVDTATNKMLPLSAPTVSSGAGNRRGQYGILVGADEGKHTSPVTVAVIAGGAGILLHTLWGWAKKPRTVYRWTASDPPL